MRVSSVWTAEADEAGRLLLPDEARLAGGLRPGARVSVELVEGRLMLGRPATDFAKLYVEPTTRCNLACRMCIRNVWTEPAGDMSPGTFESILEGLRTWYPQPQVVFSGFGEPLAHPQIAEMVGAVKQLGATTEVVTNGTLLTRELAADLVDAGLDRLWVSLDGARPESYADVRPGANLPEVLDNLSAFSRSRSWPTGKPEIGIVFVAMRRNLGDLRELVRLSARLGASRYIVTNVIPYSADTCAETLYTRAVAVGPSRCLPWSPEVRLPTIDVDQDTRETLMSLLRHWGNVRFLGYSPGQAHDRCQFIEQGAVAIGWDGSFSPCPTLLHDQVTYLRKRRRSARRYVVGNVRDAHLREVWNNAGHLAFRERVRTFEFPPCTSCGGCEMAEANEEDCFGNGFPTCGGCLWGQGVLQCP